MRQRSFRTCFWLVIWFVASSHHRATAQPMVPFDDPAVADAGQVGCPIRYTLNHFAGDAPGYDTGLTRFELFIPLYELDGSNLLFCDLQPMVYNDGNWGSNLGLGFRWFSPTFERVFGVYGYYDYRETDYHRFQQGTLGFDSLGTWLDARANVYLPEQDELALPDTAVAAPHFVGNDLRYGGFQAAMLGGDFELGVRVPVIGGVQSRLLGGVYHFDGGSQNDVTGWKARLETAWTANLSTDVALYEDDVFGTTVMVGIGLNIQAESFSPWKPRIHSFRRGPERHITHHASDRLAEPVYRLPNIAVREGTYRAGTGGDGSQVRILHVVAGATGGNGSFERPFGSLDQALAAAREGTIVYTPYGGVYQSASMFIVPEGVALLSNAPAQYIQTDVGWMQLPLSGASPELSAVPRILGSVQMSDGATLNGFGVVGTGDTLAQAGMVRIAGVSDVTVVNNTIWSRQEGLWIEDAMHVTAVNNTVAEAAGSGMFLMSGSDVTLSGNRVIAADGDGIEVLYGMNANIVGNQVDMALGNGIALIYGDHANVSDNVVGSAGQNGIEVLRGRNIHVDGNAIAEAAGDGILLADAANASVTGNTIGTAGGHGIQLIDGPSATVAGNAIGVTGGHGIAVTEGLGAEIWGNSIAAAGGHGILVTEGAGITIADNEIGSALGNGITLNYGANASLVGNRIDHSGGHGIEVIAGAGATVVGNEIGNAGASGIALLHGPNSNVRENHIASARGNGIEIYNGGGATVAENQIDSARKNGIAITHGANASIVNNEIGWITGVSGDPSTGHGISILDATSAVISGNQIGTTGRNGIWVIDGINTVIVNNQIQQANQMGIAVRTADSARIANNRIQAVDGIWVKWARNVEISGNELDWVSAHGITIVESQDVWITENTIAFAGRNAIEIVDSTNLLISGNIIERAVGNGINIRGGDFAGNLTENSITDAQTGIRVALAGAFDGAIRDNTLIASRSYGMSLEAGRFAPGSLVSGNLIDSSEWEGIRILATGPDGSLLVVQENMLILNNLLDDSEHHREFVAQLADGAGPLTIELLGNTSYNLVPLGEFNFDFLNAGSGTLLYVTDPGIPNLGTIGSSNGSVPPP